MYYMGIDLHKKHFTTTLLDENGEVLIIDEKYLVCLIFKEENFEEFIEIYRSDKSLKIVEKIILITHNIELKYICEKKIQNIHLIGKFNLFLYDWAELGPFIRSLNR